MKTFKLTKPLSLKAFIPTNKNGLYWLIVIILLISLICIMAAVEIGVFDARHAAGI